MNLSLLSIIIVLYLLVIAYLGFLGFKHTKTEDDFIVAGKSVHPYIMAISYGATFISTSAIIGFGGISAMFGMGLMWLVFLNIFVGVFLAFVFFGKKTRQMGNNLNVKTFPELLGKRFQSTFIQKIVGWIIFIFMPLYSAVVLIGGARFIEQTFAINFEVALFIFALIITVYVVAGGLKGVMYTDALQGTIMFISMLFLMTATFILLKGPIHANELLTNMANLVPGKLAAAGHQGWTAFPAFNSMWWWTLVTSLILGVGIGVLAQPQLVVRFMTVKSNKELNRAVLVGGIFILVTTGFIYMVGALSNVFFYQTEGVLAITAAKGNLDKIIPLYINKAMPSWFVYLFMLTLLSAAMSTLSSQYHAMGTSIAHDCLPNLVKKKNKIMFVRVGIVIAIMISLILAFNLPGGFIARGTAIFFGICAASFLPTFFATIYWKRASKEGAIASIFTGIIASLFGLFFLHKKEAVALGLCKSLFGKDVLITSFPWPFIDPLVFSLPLAIIVLVVVSLMTKKVTDKHLTKCFKGI